MTSAQGARLSPRGRTNATPDTSDTDKAASAAVVGNVREWYCAVVALVASIIAETSSDAVTALC
jgi:hypothetical protein